MSEWQWKDGEDDHDETAADDSCGDDGSAILADPVNDEIEAENAAPDVQNGRPGLPQDGRHRVCLTSNIDTYASARGSGFSKEAQEAQIENRQLQKAAEKANAKTFVYENSDAWQAWCQHRRAQGGIGSLPTCTHIVDGKAKRGWWMPSLYPPKPSAAGPASKESRDDSG
jgi:hypothetical protein